MVQPQTVHFNISGEVYKNKTLRPSIDRSHAIKIVRLHLVPPNMLEARSEAVRLVGSGYRGAGGEGGRRVMPWPFALNLLSRLDVLVMNYWLMDSDSCLRGGTCSEEYIPMIIVDMSGYIEGQRVLFDGLPRHTRWNRTRSTHQSL